MGIINKLNSKYVSLAVKGKDFTAKRYNDRGNKYLAIMLLGLVIVLVDAGVIVHHIQSDNQRQALINSQTSALGTRNVPSSVKPTAATVASYQVAPTLPKYLVIPAISVDARIYKLYTNPEDQVEAPDNIYDTDWYTASSLPGQPGVMFIDGHVSNWTADGVFYNLKKLVPGDTIEVVRGDNKSFTYIVKSLQTYAANSVNMSQVLSPIDPDSPGLNLMTCTGSVIPGTSEFNQRLVVYSTLES